MNKKQLEQLFDEKFEAVYEGTRLKIFKNDHDFNKVKDFIFQTVIPETLKKCLPKEVKSPCTEKVNQILHGADKGWNLAIVEAKQKAKELYNINL